MDLFLRIRQDEAPSGLETGGGALAGGDDDDGGVDRRASGDGYAGLSEPSLVLYRRRKLSGELSISRTDPFFDPFFPFFCHSCKRDWPQWHTPWVEKTRQHRIRESFPDPVPDLLTAAVQCEPSGMTIFKLDSVESLKKYSALPIGGPRTSSAL